MKSFEEKSYTAHEENIARLIPEIEARLFDLTNLDCVASRLYDNTLSNINPLLNESSSWITVGDYRGSEASYLLRHEQSYVVASDICDDFLQESKSRGIISEFKKINSESIDFEDEKFDYVLCKEALHHFPRPYISIYEMLRVSKKGVVLIEPLDPLGKVPVLLCLKNLCDKINEKLINKIWKNRFSWESCGNYVFKISEREIEKIAMGINLVCIAYKDIHVLLRINEEQFEVPLNKKVLRRLLRKISFRKFLSKIMLLPQNNIVVMIFKEMPSVATISALKDEGYRVVELPPNPYLH